MIMAATKTIISMQRVQPASRWPRRPRPLDNRMQALVMAMALRTTKVAS